MNKVMSFKPVVAPDPLHDEAIHLWWIDLSKDPLTERWRRILSQEECQRAEGFYFDRHRINYVNAHLALRKILSMYHECQPSQLLFDKEKNGKPFLVRPSNTLEFNFSHSGEVALLALQLSQPIGVDIEVIKERSILSLAKRYFSHKEASAVLNERTYTKQQLKFFQIWSQKEAFIKALGEGLRYPLDAFSTPLCETPVWQPVTDKNNKGWVISSGFIDDYAWACCTQGRETTLQCYQLDRG
jgi:4'-phosphopantetheinyl transferase